MSLVCHEEVVLHSNPNMPGLDKSVQCWRVVEVVVPRARYRLWVENVEGNVTLGIVRGTENGEC